MIERSVSAGFFKITIFPISLSNTKWIKISLEGLMTEVYVHIKIYLHYFPERLINAKLGKPTRLTF